MRQEREIMDEVSVWIEASPEEVWALVTDIGRYGEGSPENRGAQCGEELGVGVKFTGANRHGFMRWSTHCEVVEYEKPSRFAFQVRESQMRWGYRLEPENGGTKVTEWREEIGRRALPIRMINA